MPHAFILPKEIGWPVKKVGKEETSTGAFKMREGKEQTTRGTKGGGLMVSWTRRRDWVLAYDFRTVFCAPHPRAAVDSAEQFNSWNVGSIHGMVLQFMEC